jgi:putative DNA primase/helicase
MKREEEYYEGLQRTYDEEARRDEANGKGEDGFPEIHVEPGKLTSLAEQGEQALLDANCPIYRRDTVLVRPAVEEVTAADNRRTNVARLVTVSLPYLRGKLCDVAHWKRFNIKQDEWTPISPPKDVLELILDRFGDWSLFPVAGVITTPTLRPDGTILEKEGYDPETRLYLMTPPRLNMKSRPSKEDAEEAVELLDELLTEFPFVDDESRSVALSGFLTTVARGAFVSAPMHAITSPSPGSGKSYLIDTISAVATGQLCPVMAAGKKPEETEKRLGSAMLAGQSLVSIDNMNGELGGDALCQCIERPRVQIRILGQSKLFNIEARGTTIFSTGNNLILSGDIVRRSLRGLLDPHLERPEQRQFKNNPVATIMANRPKYIAAALTVVRAYVLAGSPGRAARLASFEGWSDTVRSALMWLDRADPVLTIEKAREDDPKRVQLRQMLLSWREAVGVEMQNACHASKIIDLASQVGPDDKPVWPDLNLAVTEALGDRYKVSAKSLGRWLTRQEGMLCENHCFHKRPDRNGQLWWVQPAEKPRSG